MKYVVITMMTVAIAILLGSVTVFLKIRRSLKSELSCPDYKIMIVSNVYLALISFFVIAYVMSTAVWSRMDQYSFMCYMMIFLLFFGSIFVGISILFLRYFIETVLGIKLNQKDTMTGLMTKYGIEICARKLLEEGKGEYILAVIDLDQFKKINDIYGHGKGDEVIRMVAGIIQNTVRSNDVVGRFGGDEFLVVFQSLRIHQADGIMERIEECVIKGLKEKGCQVCSGISYGLAELQGGSHASYQALFEQADRALYDMKKKKREKSL